MFSNAKKFIKKNILLVGIVVLLIIITVYFLYTNYKEGFDQLVQGKVQLIPVSTIEKFYNNLTNQTDKDIVAPLAELYKVFVANYNDAFTVSLQIIDANKEIDAAAAVVEPSANTSGPAAAQTAIQKKWAPIINPGVAKVLTNAIKWLPIGKRFYDKFVANNYYGLMDGTNNPDYVAPVIIQVFMNTLYQEDQLSILLGPNFAKSNPNPPIKMPVYAGEISALMKDSQKMEPLAKPLVEYIKKAGAPFLTIQGYIMKSTVLPDTIVQLIDQLNNALANDATDQATIGQLTGQLNLALANDATDQATITNLQGQVNNLQSRQPSSSAAPSNMPKPITQLVQGKCQPVRSKC